MYVKYVKMYYCTLHVCTLSDIQQNDTLQKQIHLDYKEQLLALKEEKEVFRSQFALVVGEREELQSEIDKWK